jgi:hypothetical protein
VSDAPVVHGDDETQTASLAVDHELVDEQEHLILVHADGVLLD